MIYSWFDSMLPNKLIFDSEHKIDIIESLDLVGDDTVSLDSCGG